MSNVYTTMTTVAVKNQQYLRTKMLPITVHISEIM